MAPHHLTGVWMSLGTGFAFGFVLERAGFGNARNLAAQFYLYDMRVLKVMFTAIVTAMLLLFASSAIGWVDFDAIAVPATHLGSAVVGGLLLGFGFILGGYCPGTSLVSLSTLKIDGALFALGVLLGLFLFGETVPTLWNFWNFSGAFGRLTLDQLVGVDAGFVVMGVVIMAVGAFWLAELAERIFARGTPLATTKRARRWHRIAVGTALTIAAATIFIGQPTTAKRIAWNETALQQRLQQRASHLDPAEVLSLMYNNQIALSLLDVRSERNYNLFHLLDAQRVTLDQLDEVRRSLSPDSVVVVMSNDERAAEEAWKRLAVYPSVNAYILAGGVNRWLDIYHSGTNNVPGADHPATESDVLRHRFDKALGDRPPAARPDLKQAPARTFVTKVKVRKAIRSPGGGCG
jgi:rhodanese-related sulfurtransferase